MEKGEAFPRFVLQADSGEEIDSDFLKGIRYVVFFYSKDNTPGCTKEVTEFNALNPKFALRNIPVFGVSKDSVASHAKFREKLGLKIKLLSDPNSELARQVGAYGEKKCYGKVCEGTIRSTFLIGKDGTVEEAWHNVKAAGHAEKVLDGTLSHFRSDAADKGLRDF
ncbi:MAG: peroxiredoxin [archaeon]|nr:peroxiredoxin [archaeon]